MSFLTKRLLLNNNNRVFTNSFSTTKIIKSTTKTETTKIKAPINLISKIRNVRPGTTLSLAKTALELNNNDLDESLNWISNQSIISGELKSKKIENRIANQGLIGVNLIGDGLNGLGIRCSMIEINCETDFVARTDEFKLLVEQVTRTLAFFAEPSVSTTSTTTTTTTNTNELKIVQHSITSIQNSPLIPVPTSTSSVTPPSSNPISTISSSIATLVSQLGENISLRRAVTISIPPVSSGSTTHLVSTYLHNSSSSSTTPSDFQTGSLASLLLFKLPTGGELEKPQVKGILRALARQVVAIPTTTVKKSLESEEILNEGEHSTSLYEQPLITIGSTPSFSFEEGSKVQGILSNWSKSKGIEGNGLEVIELERWSVGGEL